MFLNWVCFLAYNPTDHLIPCGCSNAVLGLITDIGLDRDEQELHAERLKLWSDFNLCWLALCQKQKDLTLDMIERGVQPTNFLTVDIMKNMGEELVRFCDKVEQHGLVDYEIGVWEEEILSSESRHHVTHKST